MPKAVTHIRPRASRTATPRMIIPMITLTIIMMITIAMTSIAVTIITTAIPMLMPTNSPAPPRRRAAVKADAVIEDVAQVSGDRNGMQDGEAAALYRLMTWLSPSFPVGAFSYSSGIEWAVEAGDILDAPSLRDWLAAMLADGTGFCDGIFLAHAHRAASCLDEAGLYAGPHAGLGD